MINYYFYKYLAYKSNKRSLILSRNGLINAHLYPVCDSGETFVDWKTLKMLPLFTSTSSNKGVSWWSHAIGGYKEGIEDSLLYVRFVQYGTYSPIFRFSSKAGHYYKREPWRWDVKTLKIVKDYTTIRQRLIPYLYSEAFKYSKTGLPIIQPIYYTYPDIYDEPKYKSEYYFGSELFVVPITDTKDDVMNRTVVKMFLPSGIWYDFKTGKKFPGGRQLTFFRDEDYPVFAKQGGIIPLADLKDNINDSSNPDSFTIHVFPGKNNTYKLYEDNNKKDCIETKNTLTTLIEYNYLPNNYTVIIRKLEGDSSVIPEMRKYKIKFRNTRLADDVIAYVGDQRIEVKSYKEEQDFIVEVPYVDSSKQLSINCKGKDIEIDAVHIINEDIDTIISDLKITTTLKEKIANICDKHQENV
jgi:alpha-glucosidase (family GH31 glycosyl hydrolase)